MTNIVLLLPHKQVVRYRGTLEELRTAMPEFRFTVMQKWVNGIDVLVTKRGNHAITE